MPLTDRQIKNAKPADKAYKLTDASGLYLQVTPAGGKLWRFDYAIVNKRKTLSIGKYPLNRRAGEVTQVSDRLDPNWIKDNRINFFK